VSEVERILVVDDDVEICDLIEIHLQNEGYEVVKAHSGNEALQALQQQDVQLIILDIMMGGMDGLEVCRRVRRQCNIPILFLSAKSEPLDKIMGLSTGADDYLTKPFNMLELLARVKAQLRRYLQLNPVNSTVAEGVIGLGELWINRLSHQVKAYGEEVHLTPTEFDILLLLASHPGRVFSAEEIFSRVWQEKYFESNNTVMVHMRKLREKLEINPQQPRLIKTVWGIGYKLNVERRDADVR
jgi:two-component system response regulator VanR